MNGYYLIHRGWMDHPVFDDDEPFTERTAWIWLIENAAWQPLRKRVSGKIVEVRRGQLVGSARFLAEKWGWSKSRVDRFLRRLQREKMIGTDAGHGANVITLCNYEKYQIEPENSGTPTGTEAGHERDSSGTTKNEGNEVKKEEPSGSSKTREAEAEFEFWYAGYPHKVGKADARRAYAKARRKVAADALLVGRDFYIRSKPPDRPWCNPATWLNGERWLDQPHHPTERRPDGTSARSPSAAESIFAGFAVALGQRQRAADRREDCDPSRPLLDAGDGADDPLASRH